MALIICEEGLKRILKLAVKDYGVLLNTIIRLFKNDHVPTESDTVTDYVEADFTGYASITLSNWDDPTYSSGKARIEHPQVSWTNTGAAAQDVYGYYITDASGLLLWAERDPNAPITLGPSDTYAITARMTQDNE